MKITKTPKIFNTFYMSSSKLSVDTEDLLYKYGCHLKIFTKKNI